MQKFLRYTGLFLIPVLVGFVCIEVFYRTVPSNYTFKHQQIIQKKDSIEALMLGDSHAMYGINPKWITTPTFNLANLSQTIYFDALLFTNHINELSNLNYVIIPLEYTTLSQADDTQEDIWRKYFYAEQMELNIPLIKWYNPNKYSLALPQKFNRTVRALNIWRLTGTLVNCDKNGWGLGYDTAVDSSEIEYLAKVISRKHDDGSMDFSKNLKRVEHIINACKSKNIEVILINLPVSKPYLDLLNQEEVSDIVKHSHQLANNNSHVKNLNLLFDKRFELEDFHDADHLNVKGAKKCSQILSDFILQY